MDAVFMLFYAFGSFFMATTDEKFHAPSVVGLGLCGCGFSVLLLAVGVWTDIVHQNSVSSLCFLVGIYGLIFFVRA
jgi:sugar phosphate permease